MPWIRLDDQIAHHPKFTAAGPVAAWLWVCGQSYCARYLTDGLIPLSALPTLGLSQAPWKYAEALVRVGLWDQTDDGYRVHDYHQYQPARQDVEQQREERAASGRLGGLQSGQARRARAKQSASTDEANHEATASEKEPDFAKLIEATANPVPVPVPVASKEATRARDRAPSASAFQALWNTTTLPPIPRCRELTDGRRKKISARLGERSLDDWGVVMVRVNASAFCRGLNDRGWKASFDWLIENADNAVKVLEGKYDDRDRVMPRIHPSVCRYRHKPPCADDAACTTRYLDEQRGAPPKVAS